MKHKPHGQDECNASGAGVLGTMPLGVPWKIG
jgi:hypothetical protein